MQICKNLVQMISKISLTGNLVKQLRSRVYRWTPLETEKEEYLIVVGVEFPSEAR